MLAPIKGLPYPGNDSSSALESSIPTEVSRDIYLSECTTVLTLSLNMRRLCLSRSLSPSTTPQPFERH